MPIDNTIFRHHFRLGDQHRAGRDAHIALLDASLAPTSFDGPSDVTTRPRHHFRRGAISEASGQPTSTLVRGERVAAPHAIRITSRTFNEIEITILPSSGRLRVVNNLPRRRQVGRWRELADLIRRQAANINTPSVQESINALAASLQSFERALRSRAAMEDNSTANPPDTYRYGREGWWTVPNEPVADRRPATVPGSSFRVPRSTLNLFQSMDLFAHTSPTTTLRDRAFEMQLHVVQYHEFLEECFIDTVNERRRGLDVPRGMLFTISMELSRARQLWSILEQEMDQAEEAVREAAERARSQQRGHREGEGRPSEEFTYEQLVDGDPGDNLSDSEINEPEGWTDHDFMVHDDYPEEICFHVGSQQLTFPIEDVEGWLMEEARRGGRARGIAPRARGSPVRETEPALPTGHQMLDTPAMPHPIVSTWPNRQTIRYADSEDGLEANGEYDDDVDYRPIQSYNYEESDIPATEYGEEEHEDEAEDDHNHEPDEEDEGEEDEYGDEGEEDEDGDEGEEDEDGDEGEEDEDGDGDGDGDGDEDDGDGDGENVGRCGPPSWDWEEAEQSQTGVGTNLRSPSANARVSVIDFTGSPPSNAEPDVPMIGLTSDPGSAASQSRSESTSNGSDHTTSTVSDAEDGHESNAPHPVHGWTFDHSLFMFSCRGSIFDVTRQLQHAFGFQPSLSPHLVGQRLNGETARRHQDFILTFLPGEEGINMRASRRHFSYQYNLADDDVYHGTSDIEESDVGSEDYALPPLPGMAPGFWNRRLDICLLQALNRGHFNLVDFWHRHRDLFGDVTLSAELRGFLSIRLAQVRYLGITDAERSASQQIGS